MVANLFFEGQILPGDTVLEIAKRGVTGLERLGCREGDVVAVMLRNEPAYLISALMCRLGGFYACPINWHFKAEEAGYIVKDSGARALIIHADLLRQIESGVPSNVRVVVVQPPQAIVAAFSLDGNACHAPSGSVEWRTWLADSQPYSGPDRQPRGSLPYSSGTTGRPKGIKRQPLDPERAIRMSNVCR